MNRLMMVACVLLFSLTATGATFIVPTDDELLAKSAAVVIGTVEGSYVERAEGTIQTIYEMRVTRMLKGHADAKGLIRVISHGGVLADGSGVIVPGAAHFRHGDRVLLFLSRGRRGWQITDMTLGKFRFVTSTAGAELLVRDMEDVVGWHRSGHPHHEMLRRQDGFLRYLETRAAGRPARSDYMVDSSSVTLQSSEAEERMTAASATYPPPTYVGWVGDAPPRWPNMSAGVTFYKRSDQNISGAADGGENVIRNALAAWTNDCGSAIVLNYGGQLARASQNHDSTNVIEFNDPQGRISGSWRGSGTIGYAFLSFAGSHAFAGRSWWNITDADVVFQDAYPATHASFGAAMTHEIGHGIGWRHSNQNHITNAACDPGVEECTTAAIMNSVVSGNYGYTLQPWDRNAASAVYPGATCAGTSAIKDLNGDGQSDVLWWNNVTGEFVGWFLNGGWFTSGFSFGSMGTSWRVVGAADFTGDGSMDLLWRNFSTGANLIWIMNGVSRVGTVQLPMSTPNWFIEATGDLTGDGQPDIIWHDHNTGIGTVWRMSGTTAAASVQIQGAVTPWHVAGAADFNGDGGTDLLWRNAATGQNTFWRFSGLTPTADIQFDTVADLNWRIEAVADYNIDGSPDIYWHNMANGQSVVWYVRNFAYIGAIAVDPLADSRWEGVGPK